MEPTDMVTVSLRIPRWWRPVLQEIEARELLGSPSALMRRTLMEKYPELRSQTAAAGRRPSGEESRS